jgi:hypothetical protein
VPTGLPVPAREPRAGAEHLKRDAQARQLARRHVGKPGERRARVPRFLLGPERVLRRDHGRAGARAHEPHERGPGVRRGRVEQHGHAERRADAVGACDPQLPVRFGGDPELLKGERQWVHAMD